MAAEMKAQKMFSKVFLKKILNQCEDISVVLPKNKATTKIWALGGQTQKNERHVHANFRSVCASPLKRTDSDVCTH